MSRKMILAVLVLTVGLGFAYLVVAEDKPAAAGAAGGMGQCCGQMMKEGMSEGMKLRCKMMLGACVSKDSPAGILALADDLKLTAGQAQELADIDKQARSMALGVLTGEQKKQLEALSGTPETMAAMCEKMGCNGMLQEKPADKPADTPACCPGACPWPAPGAPVDSDTAKPQTAK